MAMKLNFRTSGAEISGAKAEGLIKAGNAFFLHYIVKGDGGDRLDSWILCL